MTKQKSLLCCVLCSGPGRTDSARGSSSGKRVARISEGTGFNHNLPGKTRAEAEAALSCVCVAHICIRVWIGCVCGMCVACMVHACDIYVCVVCGMYMCMWYMCLDVCAACVMYVCSMCVVDTSGMHMFMVCVLYVYGVCVVSMHACKVYAYGVCV